MHQIAVDNAPDEETRNIIKTGFYMDGLFHGSDTIPQCQNQIAKIIKTLKAGKLPLTKWVSNETKILEGNI